jgi:hypothetical protein
MGGEQPLRRRSAPDVPGFCRDRPMLVRLGDNEDTTKVMIEALRKVIKRMHYPLEVMLTCVRWCVAYQGPRRMEVSVPCR